MSNETNINYGSALGLLQYLTAEELQQLLDDDERAQNVVKDAQQLKDIEAEREILLASNKSLAEYNLSQQPTIEETKQQVTELYKIAIELKPEVEENKQKIESWGTQTSLDTIQALLQAATAELEEEAEVFAENFLEGKISVEEFMKEYIEKRKHSYLRRIKAEKMNDILIKSNSSPLTPVRPPPTPPPRKVKSPAPAPPQFTPLQVNQPAWPQMHPTQPVNSSPLMPYRPAPQPPVSYPQPVPYPYPSYANNFVPGMQQVPQYR